MLGNRRLLMGCLPVFTILLIGSASLNYQLARSTLENEARNRLNEDWAAMKGYLRIEYNPAVHGEIDQWYYDDRDADQAAAVHSIQERCFIADENGRVLRDSLPYHDAGMDSPATISGRIRRAVSSSEVTKAVWTVRQGALGSRYLMRGSIVFDERRRSPFYVALVTPVSDIGPVLLRFTLTLSGTIVSALLLGWALACVLTAAPPPRGGSV